MVFEIRVYQCCPGRLPALQARFAQNTLGFFNKHGIRPLGFWTTLVGTDNHELSYMLQWNDMAEREARWNSFQDDPDWIKARRESEADQPIVMRVSNQFLSPCNFFPTGKEGL